MDPKKVLKRGYSIISDENNNLLNGLNLKKGDNIKLIFDKGYALCNVLEVKHEK